jgi:hypothetical protein
MQLHFGVSVSRPVLPRSGGGQQGGGGTAARFSAANADGWTAAYAAPPTFDPVGAPEQFSVQRAGFTTAGTPTTYADLMTVTRRLRQVYPNQAVLTPGTAALSDYVYAGDTITGAANNSAEQSPKPVANWVMQDRIVVGNTVALEIAAFHREARGGEQVACVEFSATDGTTTVTQKVSASVVSGRASDRNAVIVHRCDLDISGLANPAVITCNAKVYPWRGTAAAVRDSAASAVAREFSPRVFTRNTARAAAPPLAYVATTGNDATGVVSTVAATARATPFLTVLGAIKGLKAATGVTGGRIDGCEVRLGAGSFAAGSLAATDVTGGIQDNAVVTITRDPTAAKSAAVLTFGAAAFRTRFPWLRIADCTVLRTGLLAFQGEAAPQLMLTLDDVIFDNANNNASILNNSHVSVFGCDLLNAGSSPFSAATYEVRVVRGMQNTGGATIENWLLVGSRLTGGSHASGLLTAGTRSSNGAICAYNYLSGYRPTYGSIAEMMACAVVQNVIEFFSATSNTGLSVSPDSGVTNTSHVVLFHNTVAGFFNNGRSNLFYDETPGTARTHRLLAAKGNIQVSVNNKGDVFLLDGTRTGNWPYLYGVGVACELHQFDAAAPGFRQEFAGMGSLVGTSTTVPVSPQFAAPGHTVTGPAAGAAGGTYTLQAGSPAKALMTAGVLRFDLAGQARPVGSTSAGAYH